MKLLNKKTGEIFNSYTDDTIELFCRRKNDEAIYRSYASIAELNDEWVDYKPKEPLIKDKRTRKAIRAWAEANGLDTMPIYYDANYNRFCDDRDFSVTIDFYREVEGELLSGHSYYLTELCGEVEE